MNDKVHPAHPPELLPPPPPPHSPSRPLLKNPVPVVIAIATLAIVAGVVFLFWRASHKTNDVALASDAKPVTVVEVVPAQYHSNRRYIATLEPWLEARIGPQIVSGYVDTVLFRPGSSVKKGDVLATLDCRSASAKAQAVSEAARALETQQAAVAKEASRIEGMRDGGFVSENEVDKKRAESATEEANILSEKAKLLGSSLEVDDCILRAPFDGEIAERLADPGSFVRPGSTILTLVDRSTVRASIDVPEIEFGLVATGKTVHLRLLATGKTVTAVISRSSPSADTAMRTIHAEVDLSDPEKSIPVGTTADATIDVGEPIDAAELPLSAASIRGEKAVIFTVDQGIAKKISVAVLGETGGSLFVDPSLAGKWVVTEGRSLLNDGDRVEAKKDSPASPPTPSASSATAPQAKP